MGLPWVRLDTALPDNPKILGMLTERDGHRAAFVWICCLSYAGKHETDGFVPREALTRVNGRLVDMARLVDHGLLVQSAGGWTVKGWDEFQLSGESARARREKAQKAAAARWSRREGLRSAQ
jgi:hypothetical protein